MLREFQAYRAMVQYIENVMNTVYKHVLSGSYLSEGEVLFFQAFCTPIPSNYNPPCFGKFDPKFRPPVLLRPPHLARYHHFY